MFGATQTVRHRRCDTDGATQTVRGGERDDWAERYGDWSLDTAMHVAVRQGGLRLAEVVRKMDGLRYQAAAQVVKRFAQAMNEDSERRRFAERLQRQFRLCPRYRGNRIHE